MTFQKVPIGSFLVERESRIKPAEANKMGLKRLNKINFSGEIHLSDKNTNTDMILVKNGDLVISGINVEKGAVAVYQGKEDIIATIHYSTYIYNKEKIDLEYLKIFLMSSAFKEAINSQTRGGIKTEIKPKTFLKLEIYLPDLKTQIEIRNKLKNRILQINDYSEIQEKNESHISKLRQSILQSAVQGKLVKQDPKDEPANELLMKIKTEKEKLIKEGKIRKDKPLASISEDEIPYELPKGWEWCRLGDLCYLITDGTHQTPKYVPEGIPFLSVKNVAHGSIDFSDCKHISKEEHADLTKRCKPEYMDLLLTKVGTTGIAILIDTKQEFSIFVSVALLKYPKNLIYPKYLEHVINSPIVKKQSDEETEGIGNKNLVLRKITHFSIPLPPLAEQKRIVEKVDKLMAYCDELEKQVKENQENAEKLMSAVLKEGFEN